MKNACEVVHFLFFLIELCDSLVQPNNVETTPLLRAFK